jgi:rare lipoprotein A
MKKQIALALFSAMFLAACGTTPNRGTPLHTNYPPQTPQAAQAQQAQQQVSAPIGNGAGYLPGDGPGNSDATRLASTPDAVPRAEPLHRYANRPYDALGKHYVPQTAVGNYKKRGVASWYGKKFHGQRTSSGEVYDMYGMTAAHPTLPIPSYARVTNLRNGRSVVVRVNDRGPFMHERIMDVSYAAAYKLDIIGSGSGEVEVESLHPGQYAPATQVVSAEPVRAEPLPAEPAYVAPAPAYVAPAYKATDGRVFLQLGSFNSPQGAEGFLVRMRNELGDLGKQVVLYSTAGLSRVHIGPYRTADEARTEAQRMESRLGFKPFVSYH